MKDNELEKAIAKLLAVLPADFVVAIMGSLAITDAAKQSQRKRR